MAKQPEAFRTRGPAEIGSSRPWLKQMTTEFKQRLTVEIGIEMARLSPWLSNQSMWLRPVPFLTETLKEEQREEEGKMKNLLSILMVISTYALLMENVEDHGDGDGAMQVETEVVDSVFSNWPQEQGAVATELLDLFLVHGVEPGVARLKVTELFSPPRPTVLPRAIPDFVSICSRINLRSQI